MGLILNMKTGLVSPSYHNTYDDEYATVTKPFGKYVPKSEWQVKCAFKQDPLMPLLTMGQVTDAGQMKQVVDMGKMSETCPWKWGKKD
jgi:3-hydroxymyristoyl/3-hydroxydecanoyl-(acyl carrier protein) dehydratase